MIAPRPPWLRQAMTGVLTATPRRVLWLSAATTRPATAAGAGGACWHPSGLRAHPIPEIIVPLDGDGRLRCGDGVRRLARPSLAIIPPGVPHCEGFGDRRQVYAALWLILHGATASALVSRHRPGGGETRVGNARVRRGCGGVSRPRHQVDRSGPGGRWDTAYRATLRDPAVTRLAEAIAARSDRPARLTAAEAESLGTQVLAVLSRLQEQDLARPARRAAIARGWRRHADLLAQIDSFLDAHLDRPLRLDDLAALAHLTPRYLNRLFRLARGEPLHARLIRLRMEKAAALCRQPDLLVKEIAAAVGYADPLYFSRCFARHHGRSVTAYRLRAGRAA